MVYFWIHLVILLLPMRFSRSIAFRLKLHLSFVMVAIMIVWEVLYPTKRTMMETVMLSVSSMLVVGMASSQPISRRCLAKIVMMPMRPFIHRHLSFVMVKTTTVIPRFRPTKLMTIPMVLLNV